MVLIIFRFFSFDDIFKPLPYKKFDLKEWADRIKDEDVCREYPAAVIDGSFVQTLGDRFEASMVVQRAEILVEIMKKDG